MSSRGCHSCPFRFFYLIFFAIILCTSTEGRTCVKDPSSTCKCTTDDGYTFDLTPAAQTGGKPRYEKSVTVATTTELFQYNPCIGFACGSSPATSAVCDTTPDNLYAIVGGTQDSVSFQFDSNQQLQATYSTASTGLTYTTTITFVCSQNTAGFGNFDMQTSGTTYTGTLTSKYSCLTSGESGGGSGLSDGDILLIIFFVLLAVYLICGILFQALYRKQRGIEMIPNRQFWLALPGLTKDGFVFVLVKLRLKKQDSYESI